MSTKYAVPMKVVKLIQKVQAHILEEPRRFDMAVLVQQYSGYMLETDQNLPNADRCYPACGTVGCIAGWSVLLSDVPTKNMTDIVKVAGKLQSNYHSDYRQGTWRRAAKLLGLAIAPAKVARALEALSSIADNYWDTGDSFLDARGLSEAEVKKAATSILEKYGKTTDHQLFLEEYWPEPFRSQYRKINVDDDAIYLSNAKRRKLAKIAVQRLDYFLTTGK